MAFLLATRRGRVLRRGAAAGLVAGLATLGAVVVPSVASAAPGSIAPGATVVTGDAQCTANFVYSSGSRVFLGYAAHCAAVITDPVADADGCLQAPLPLGTAVTIEGASKPAKLVYSSWMAMQANGVGPGDLCQYNDFALAEVDPADAASVDPTVPALGGPTALSGGVAVGDQAFSYEPNIMTPAVKQGVVSEVLPGGLAYLVKTDPPSVAGDSGSGYLDGAGAAFGLLSAGDGASVVTDLAKALAYANANGDLGGVSLERGNQPFSTAGVAMTPVPGGTSLSEPSSVLTGSLSYPLPLPLPAA